MVFTVHFRFKVVTKAERTVLFVTYENVSVVLDFIGQYRHMCKGTEVVRPYVAHESQERGNLTDDSYEFLLHFFLSLHDVVPVVKSKQPRESTPNLIAAGQHVLHHLPSAHFATVLLQLLPLPHVHNIQCGGTGDEPVGVHVVPDPHQPLKAGHLSFFSLLPITPFDWDVESCPARGEILDKIEDLGFPHPGELLSTSKNGDNCTLRKWEAGIVGRGVVEFHGRGGNAFGNPVHRPLGDVVVKEGEYCDQLVPLGEFDEADEHVWLVKENGVLGVTVLDERRDALVVVEAGRKHVPQVFQCAATHSRDEAFI